MRRKLLNAAVLTAAPLQAFVVWQTRCCGSLPGGGALLEGAWGTQQLHRPGNSHKHPPRKSSRTATHSTDKATVLEKVKKSTPEALLKWYKEFAAKQQPTAPQSKVLETLRTQTPLRVASLPVSRYGRVLRWDFADGVSVAVKFAPASCLQREYKMLQAVQNVDGVPRVYGLLGDESRGCLVMEMLDGCDLTSMRGAIEPQAFSWCAKRLLQILRDVHACGVVHCDVKPDNIVLTSENKLYLIDFGGAFLKDEVPDKITYSPHYAAPEAYSSDRFPDGRFSCGPAADIYSLGMTLYSLGENKMPRRVSRSSDQPAGDERTTLLNKCKKLGDDAKHLVGEMLWPDFAQRPSAASLLEVKFLQGVPEQPPAKVFEKPCPPTPTSFQSKNSRLLTKSGTPRMTRAPTNAKPGSAQRNAKPGSAQRDSTTRRSGAEKTMSSDTKSSVSTQTASATTPLSPRTLSRQSFSKRPTSPKQRSGYPASRKKSCCVIM